LNRLKHVRASFLLLLSSTSLFWVISYWLPLPTYLSAIAKPTYDDYRSLIQIIVISYLAFAVLNIVIAVLLTTKIAKKTKFWLVLTPAIYLFLIPFIVTIPAAIKFPNRNYFEVFQALFRLFRFTKIDTFALALVFTFLAVALNVFAAIVVLRSGEADSVPSKLRNRYLIYTAIVSVLCAVLATVFAYNSTLRALDRQACYDYKALAVPTTDEEVPTFLNELTLYGQQAGSTHLKNAFSNFTGLSRDLFTALDSENVDDATIQQYQTLVAVAKNELTILCSEFATD
jgi:hypothetical protein